MKSKQFLFFLMDIAVFIRAGYWDKFHKWCVGWIEQVWRSI